MVSLGFVVVVQFVLVVLGSSKCLIPVRVQDSPGPLSKYLGFDIVVLLN